MANSRRLVSNVRLAKIGEAIVKSAGRLTVLPPVCESLISRFAPTIRKGEPSGITLYQSIGGYMADGTTGPDNTKTPAS